jgi:hypothetical protein
VRRVALEDYYERLVRSRASNGVEAMEQIMSGEAADEMSALEDELDDARADHDASLFRQKMLSELMEKAPDADADAREDDSRGDAERAEDEAADFNPQS